MYPYIMLVFVVIFYAGNILIGKLINDLPPFTVAFFRLLVAFLLILPISYKSAWAHRHSFLNHWKSLITITVTGVAFFNTFIYGALQFTSATNVSVLETVIPVLTVILSGFILRERLRALQWFGVGLSFLGALWVVIEGQLGQLAAIQWNIGDLIMVGAIVSWAIYSIVVKQSMHLFPPLGVLLMMTGISLIVLFPFVGVEWWLLGVPALMKTQFILGFLYLGIFPSLIALLFYNTAVDRLGASMASVFLNFLPVVTMIGAYFWLGERISSMQITGALLVIAGVIMTTQVKRRKKTDRMAKSRLNDT